MKHDNLDLIKHHITQANKTLEESIFLKIVFDTKDVSHDFEPEL